MNDTSNKHTLDVLLSRLTHVVVDTGPADSGGRGLDSRLNADDQVGEVTVGRGELVLLLQNIAGQCHTVRVQGSHRRRRRRREGAEKSDQIYRSLKDYQSFMFSAVTKRNINWPPANLPLFHCDHFSLKKNPKCDCF